MKKIALALLLALLLPVLANGATTERIRVQVVDAETNAPIEGAWVVYQVAASEGTFTGHGGKIAQLAVLEAVTNHEGIFVIPAQSIDPYPFWFSTNYSAPNLWVFKSGYNPASTRQLWYAPIFPKLEDILQWGKEKTELRLNKAESPDQYLEKIKNFNSELGGIYDSRDIDQCSWEKSPWKNFPNTIIHIEDEVMSMENPGKKIHFQTMLRNLLRNEAYRKSLSRVLKDDCGSPSKFFENYPPSCPDSPQRMVDVKREFRTDKGSSRSYLMTSGYCPVDNKHWVFQEGQGWKAEQEKSSNTTRRIEKNGAGK